MRSARMILATAAAAAALAFATPGAAFAVPAERDSGGDDSSYSKEHDSGSDREDQGSDDEQDNDYGNKRGSGREHDGPRGGMHTGGGALAAVRSGDWGSGDDSRFDPESYKDKGDDSEEEGGGKSEKGEKSGRGEKGERGDKGDKSEWGDDHEKPRGGMHTGGGALATPGVTAGGLAVLAVGAAGAYALRRRKAAEPVS
ncbi:hypothetical protein [Streptomyces sp. NRRL B-3648]|uniref:hypothetical protein n=1 Tax=Streptomyces sp. NRRL B-3648 TaxID=1519493 RepID=UPI0006AEB7C3|nr:hypothetical protein [Streptomyces sp. NRRL B-3648]KOV92957.1 membrane protein [Streptomyces sp. NRRL B-3648]